MLSTAIDSPLGTIAITASDEGVTSISFVEEKSDDTDRSWILDKAVTQLQEYFARSRTEFDLPLDIHGTDFQKRVWSELQHIAYGATTSYQRISSAIGDLNASRAVGLANGKNPIAIVIPCHRVIGSGGALTGYSGGLWRKEWLLNFESGSNLFA